MITKEGRDVINTHNIFIIKIPKVKMVNKKIYRVEKSVTYVLFYKINSGCSGM